jgi:serralysin
MTAGGQSDDTITLASGNNWISGDLGNDTLTGSTGNDAFVFATTLNSTTNVDTITDFKATGAGTDKIWLARSVFTGLTAGTTLDATDFGTTAALGADVVYDSSSKGLFFKAGGASDLSGYTQFATLGGTSTTSVGNCYFVLF